MDEQTDGQTDRQYTNITPKKSETISFQSLNLQWNIFSCIRQSRCDMLYIVFLLSSYHVHGNISDNKRNLKIIKKSNDFVESIFIFVHIGWCNLNVRRFVSYTSPHKILNCVLPISEWFCLVYCMILKIYSGYFNWMVKIKGQTAWFV
jgi:hypothetical protein